MKTRLLLAAALLGALTLHANDQTPDEAKRLEKRELLKSTVLPDVSWNAVPLREALAKLRQLVREAQPGSEEQRKGINIVLKLNGSTEAKAVTLEMKSPTLEAVFLEIGRQTHCLVVAEPYCIALVPDTERVQADRLISAPSL